jgi:hypothetical protein
MSEAAMEPTLATLRTFHLTGENLDHDFANLAELHLVPALLSRYRDLRPLRYDYPLVLTNQEPDLFVKSLSSIIDAVLQDIAPRGIHGERTRRNLLSLEAEIRSLAAQRSGSSLVTLWNAASARLLSNSDTTQEEKQLLEANLARATRSLAVDGEVIHCDADTPAKLLVYAWKAIEQSRARSVLAKVEALITGLSDILRAEYLTSKEGLSPDSLRTSLGTSFEEEIDFASMSGFLIESSTELALPKARRQRIRYALSVLQSQRFFAFPEASEAKRDEAPYSFIVSSCSEALETYRSRRPDMIAFLKALCIAELELANDYDETKHDSFLDRFDEDSLRAEDVSLFPSYLLCLKSCEQDQAENALLLRILSSDLPIKVLFEPDEVFQITSARSDGNSIGRWDLRLANIAMSLGGAYVLQATSSNAYLLSDRISEGLRYQGPALFSMFPGSTANFPSLTSYLVCASAAQSRAFPAFVYNPDAGESWAARFCVDGNPQREAAWPVDGFCYEDGDIQLVAEQLPFTLIDFAANDRRFFNNFVSVPQAKWNENMVPVGDYLQAEDGDIGDKVPYILMVDDDNCLHRVVVTHNLIAAARRCAQMWSNLQELGGIHNSHALTLLDRERQVWEQEKQREIERIRSQHREEIDHAAGVEVPPVGEEEKIEEAAEERGPVEEAFIETSRCNTCDECTKKNDRMFAYNENKQAFIKDIDAGTFRELVEAAEVCKVAIIHPGKPRNPAEPNLEDLIKRAESFN